MPALEPAEELRDTIPRMYHLTSLSVVLAAIAESLAFDRIRARVGEEARVQARRAAPAAPPVDDGYLYWSTTKDALAECMKLALVERTPLPSKRAQVDAHRERTYALTPEGHALHAELSEHPGRFRQIIAPVLLASHPYYAALLERLGRGPIVLRTYTEEELRAHKDAASAGRWVDRVADEVARHGERAMGLPYSDEVVAALAAGVRDGLRRRFAETEAPRPKDVLDTIDDVVCTLTLDRLGLPIDAISFNVLMNWSRWLYLADESRYVAGFEGRVIWAAAGHEPAAADAHGARPRVTWRGLTTHGDRVADVLPDAYRALATEAGHPADHTPLLPIYAVRGTAAFRAGVSTTLVERVLAQIADGERDVPYAVRLAVAGAAAPPASESPLVLGDRVFYLLSLTAPR